MRKFFVLAVAVLLLSFGVFAQDAKTDIFGGYSLLHSGVNSALLPSQNSNGWDASATRYFNRYLGVTADFSGQYSSQDIDGITTSGRAHNFLFGPTVAYRKSKVTPFAHALFGVSHLTGSTNDGSGAASVPGENSFAMALGGGVDVKASKLFDIRLGQLDYLRTQFGDSSQNHMRYAAGIVFKF